MTYFMFDPIGLSIVIFGCFMGGFLPLLVVIGRCPEAKTFIKCQLGGGVILSRTSASGERSFSVIWPLSKEGQYISGPNAFGQREVYIRPQTTSGQFNKSFFLTGIRRPIFDAFSGKTVLVPPTILAAIKIAETEDADKGNIPADVKRWAEDNKISLKELVELAKDAPKVDAKDTPAQVPFKGKIYRVIYRKLFELDPTTLSTYFKEFLTQGQIDVLLEKAKQVGYLDGIGARVAGAGGKNKWALIGIGIFIILIIVGVVGLMFMRG